MATILTLIIIINLIYGSAIVWCIKTSPLREKKPTKKMIQQRQEYFEMIEYKLSRDYVKLKAV